MDLREITKQTAPIQKSQLGQHPQVKRQKLQRQETDGSKAQSAFQQLDRRQNCPGSIAQSVSDNGYAARRQLPGPQRGAVDLKRCGALQPQQEPQGFPGPAQRLPKGLPHRFAKRGQTIARAKAAGHTEGQIALEQRPQQRRQPLGQKAEGCEEKTTGCAPGRCLAAHAKHPGVNRQKPQQKASPFLQLSTKLIGQGEEPAPEQNAAPSRGGQLQELSSFCSADKKRQHRRQQQEYQRIRAAADGQAQRLPE